MSVERHETRERAWVRGYRVALGPALGRVQRSSIIQRHTSIWWHDVSSFFLAPALPYGSKVHG